MKQQAVTHQQEWLKVLGKGMVTLPKKWREELGITTGDIVKAKKEGNKVIIEPQIENLAPYRVYNDSEIETFLEEDKVSASLSHKVQKNIASLSK